MMHRILHILDHSIPLHSGYTFRTLSILREQKRLGWHTFHVTSPKHVGGERDEEDVDGWHFYRTHGTSYGAWPAVREVRMMRHLERRIEAIARSVRPDVLHAHSPALNGLPAINVGRRMGIPVVYEIRAFWEDAAVDHGTTIEGGVRYRLTRAMETYTARRVDHVTTICEGLRDDLINRGIPGSKITVIPNAVDADAFASTETLPVALREAHQLSNAFVIGFIGSFYAYEGIDRLIEALPRLAEHVPNIRLLLVGGGPQDENLRQLARRLRVEDRTVFAGRVPQAQVSAYYDLTDAMVYPRQPMRLTELVTPLKPLEAMAKKRLVIASDVGGHRELIDNRVTGLLFPATDLAAMCDTIGSVAARPEQFDAVREAGYLHAKRERTWQNSVQRYQSIYASLRSTAISERDVVEAQ